MAPCVTLLYFRFLNYRNFSTMMKFSLNLIWVIKSTRMRWVRHVASMGEWRVAYRFSWVDLSERAHLENLGVDRRIICNESSVSVMWGYGLDRDGSG